MKTPAPYVTLYDVKQNKYDDPGFFASYSNMERSVHGLAAAGEWPAFRKRLPDLAGKRVLDLGCGFGWHCRYAIENGARSVTGVDISEKMLARARSINNDMRIEYVRTAIEDFAYPVGTYDLVISSLAFHYVADFGEVCRRIAGSLAPGGKLVFSVEHPIFTASGEQEWCVDANSARRHWPVDNYFNEGTRDTNWMAEHVIKYHRTMETYLNTVVGCGFSMDGVDEPCPDSETLRDNPDWHDEIRRPMFLLISAKAPA